MSNLDYTLDNEANNDVYGMTRITNNYFIPETQFVFHYDIDNKGRFYVFCDFPRKLKLPGTPFPTICVGLCKDVDENGNLYWKKWDNCMIPDQREERWQKALSCAFDEMPAVEEKRKLFEDMRQEFLAKRDGAIARWQEEQKAKNPPKSFGDIVLMVLGGLVWFFFWVWFGVAYPKTACAAAIFSSKKK